MDDVQEQLRAWPADTVERWLPIPGFNAYEVSNFGSVRRRTGGRGTRAGRAIKPCADAYGRMVFNVTDADGSRRQLKVHRAVMLAFVGDCPPGMEVAHKNGDQSVNTLFNLMYATPAENNSHKKRHGTQPMGVEVWNARLNEDAIRWIRANSGVLSLAAMARELGVALMTVQHVRKRRTWKHLD